MQGVPKLLSVYAPTDALIAYVTDVRPVLAEAHPLLVRHHRDGDAFATTVLAAGDDLLTCAATADTETAEALAATTVQTEVLARGTATVRQIRSYGAFVAGELNREGGDPRIAQRMLTACGVGSRVALQRQSGVRRALLSQQAGLGAIADMLALWPPPADFPALVAQAIADLDVAIREQSREALEADLAQDEVDLAAGRAVSHINRALRLLGTFRTGVPPGLMAKLASLEAEHGGVFNRPNRGTAPTAEAPVEGDGDGDGEPDAAPAEV